MSTYVIFVLVALVLAGLTFWSISATRARRQTEQTAREKLGFRPCDLEKSKLEEIVTRIENNRNYRYEVRKPLRWAGASGDRQVYSYVKVRHGEPDDDAYAEEELLVPLKRRSAGGLVLTLKPTALAHGLATRLIGAVAAGPWDVQPDDLQRIEIPHALKNGNVVAALGSPGASLYDVVDSSALEVLQDLGDAGALCVRLRDEWCSISGVNARQMPFQLEQLLSRIQPLLRTTP
ncbi:MAG: hypothetical protein ACRENP_13370 [Longimicrobiales bacterium]